jgi:cytochrome c5
MSHSPLIKTWQQLVAVVAAAFIVPIVVILLIASLITSGRKGGAEASANVLARIAPVGTVVVDASAPGVTATAAGSPSAPAATPKPAAPVVAAAIPPPPPAAAAKADGKKVYDTACTACHTPGIAGAPKVGDKAAWSPRIAQGANVLYEHAIKGYQGKNGVMPPKGGNTALSDADVKAAVDYMTSASK